MEKCITCGFLCKYVPGDDVPTPKFFEMESKDREIGKAYELTISRTSGRASSVPACFRGVEDAQNDFARITSRSSSDQFYEIVNRDRQCDKWIQYEPGFSPMDHLQDLRMNELELKRQVFEHGMEADNKSFMGELHRSNRNLQIFLAIVVAIFTIAQMAFPNGWQCLMMLLGSHTTVPPLQH